MQALLSLLWLVSTAQALYFFIDGATPKCFYEELPKDTLVSGQYAAEEYDDRTASWQQHQGLNIFITVDEVFNDHRVVNKKGDSSGKFHFTAHEAGDHKICFTPSSTSGRHSWLSTSYANGGIKLKLDMVIGASDIESSDKGKINDITTRVKDLTARLNDIRREQVFQREREAEFRDQSESTNSRVVRWIIIQLIVLGATCAWQLSHLRTFFIKQKLT